MQLPNGPGTGIAGTIDNLAVNVPNTFDINRYFLRIDHHFSSRDQISGNFNSSKGDPYLLRKDSLSATVRGKTAVTTQRYGT